MDLRVEVRHAAEGVTQAALQLPDTSWVCLLSVSTAAYEGSQEVRTAVEALARAVVHQLVREAVGDGETGRQH